MKTDEQVLTEALALVEKDGGWCQGALCKDSGGQELVYDNLSDRWFSLAGRTVEMPASFCLEGAIRYAATGTTSWWDVRERRANSFSQLNRLFSLVNRQGIERNPLIPELSSFNDRATTTQEDAVLVLKKALTYVQEQS
jgi:hypothetical protein